METNLFHFMRPEWFWALIPAGLLLWLVMRSRKSATGGNWGKYVDAHLLRYLAMSGATARASRFLPSVAAAMLVVLVTALAGPTWQKAEVPSFTGGEPVVAVLSLAQSMNSDDLSPSRLRSAVHKLRDVLARTEGDERALVIYSDIPFVAAPLTSDNKVISQMIPDLSTKLMPVLGDRPDLAISEAVSVLKGANATRGKIVLLADNAGDAAATEKAAADARKAGYTVSVLGVGTEKGATLQTAGGQAITDRSGEKVTTSLDAETLGAVAKAGGGVYSSVTANSTDLDHILPKTEKAEAAGKSSGLQSRQLGRHGVLAPDLAGPASALCLPARPGLRHRIDRMPEFRAGPFDTAGPCRDLAGPLVDLRPARQEGFRIRRFQHGIWQVRDTLLAWHCSLPRG